jgi:hypothetical protein
MICRSLNRAARLWRLLPAISAVFAAGCITPPFSDPVIGGAYQPHNVYSGVPRLPKDIRRVAMLPMSIRTNDSVFDAGRDELQPVLYGEVGKTKAFELVTVDPVQLRHLTGRLNWSGQEDLPRDFLERLQQSLGCDAVMFCQLTLFRPYVPVAVGWQFKLVACKQAQVLWSADEVFDTGNPAVQNAARRYAYQHVQDWRPTADSRSVLVSPRLVAQYAAADLLATLPPR